MGEPRAKLALGRPSHSLKLRKVRAWPPWHASRGHLCACEARVFVRTLARPPTSPLTRLPASLLVQTFKLTGVYATVGGDYDLGTKDFHPRWELQSAVGRAVELRVNEDGCTVSKNWDADMGGLSCCVELKAHCNWHGRVRPGLALRTPPRVAHPLLQPTLSIDAVPTRTVTKAVIGGMAFAVGKTLDLNPSVKLGKLPVKLEVGASIYKEGPDPMLGEAGQDVFVLRVRSVDAFVAL
jgi:hypothetical protein